MNPIDVNTVSIQPTHFLRGVELISQARSTFNIPSENWANPTAYRFGSPNDNYYAEIWVDGMAWQNSYWVIESFDAEDPECLPFIIFEDSENRKRFNDYDFGMLIHASLFERRDRLWIKQGENLYLDQVWAFFKPVEPVDILRGSSDLVKYSMMHASQPRVVFYMNNQFVPEGRRP